MTAVIMRCQRGESKAKIRIASLDFRKTVLGSFRDQLQSMPWPMGLERRGKKKKKIQCISKDHLLQAEELSIRTCRRKPSKGSKRPV